MKSSKYFKITKTWSWKTMSRSRRNVIAGVTTKLDYIAFSLIMLSGMSGLIIMLYNVACHGSSSFVCKSPDWDKQRAMWMDRHPNLRPLEGQRPRIMMVTGSSSQPRESAVLNHAILQSAKNKVDYCRLHDIPLYYSTGNPARNEEFNVRFRGDWWVTLPLIRMLMLQHPEVEWIWWVDVDAVFTDMSLEPPFADVKHHNLLLFRENRSFVKTNIHTGNFLIRNCQWTLDLILLWETASSTTKAGDHHLSSSANEFAAARKLPKTFDARKLMVTSLVAYPLQDDAAHKVIETESWIIVAPHLEELQGNLQQKEDRGKLPLVTHFAGCIPCGTSPPNHGQPKTPLTEEQQSQYVCLEQLDRTFDFADNQIYGHYGFQRRALGSSKMEPFQSEDVTEERAAADHSLEEFSMLPKMTLWDELRSAHNEKSAVAGTTEEVILVSGSSPEPCHRAVGDQILVRGLKNKIDYCRLHGIEIFYNMAAIDKHFTGWWSKLPLLRMLMLKNPGVEWLWWMDSDAVVTDMDFEIPLKRSNAYGGYNLVIYGNESLLYDERSSKAIDTSNFFVRNCQWSIDLLDRWASYASTPELREKNEQVISTFLKDRQPNWEADDQSVLVYMLITEGKRWSSKVLLENTELDISANWEYWTPRFKHNVPLLYKPFVTHFEGCKPCGKQVNEKCLTEMDRTLDFADNQVLESAGRCHEHLGSPNIVSSCSIRPEIK